MKQTRFSDNKGMTIVFLAVVLLVLLSMAALAIDLGRLYIAKQRAQNVADAAALAGGGFLTGSPDCEPEAAEAADHCAASNNDTNTGMHWAVQKPDGSFAYGTIVGINFPTSFAKDDGTPVTVDEGCAMQASAAVPVNFGFARIMGFTGQLVNATAIVTRTPLLELDYPVCPWAFDKRRLLGDLSADPPIEPIQLGDTKKLKVTSLNDPEAFIGPANFLALALEDDRGGKDYREQIAGTGGSIDISVGDSLDASTEPGNMQGPTRQGVSARLADSQFENDATAWDDWLATGDADGHYATDSRIVIVPVIEITDPVAGRGQVTVVGFAAFFIESYDNADGAVVGRFIEGIMHGGKFSFMPPKDSDPGTDPNLLDSIKLVA